MDNQRFTFSILPEFKVIHPVRKEHQFPIVTKSRWFRKSTFQVLSPDGEVVHETTNVREAINYQICKENEMRLQHYPNSLLCPLC